MSYLLLALLASVYDDTPLTVNPDPYWQPGTYQEYLADQPKFQSLQVRQITGETRGSDFLVLMEENMSDSLDSDIVNQWLADIASEGNTVSLAEITYAEPVEIRTWLQGLHAEGLKGVVFVGDIPAPWSCIEDNTTRSNETFPSDYFYMDLDGDWQDNWIGYPSQGVSGQDDIYDGWSGDLDPEIYTARILTSVILLGNEYELINNYLERLHQWRIEGDPDPHALCYVDDDWAGWGNSYKSAMEYLYDDVELVNQYSATNGTDYRNNRLPSGYTWISPFVHSSPTSHAWSPGPSTTSGHIWTDQPPSRFYNLFACSNCRFTSNWCMGCTYTFGTASGIAAVGSTKSGSMLKFAYFYSPLGNGSSFGEAYQAWWNHIAQGGLSPHEQYWHLGMVILGDPTVMPSMHMLGIEEQPAVPSISFSANPAAGPVTVFTEGEFTVVDMAGRTVAFGQGTETLTNLGTGVYMVRSVENGVSAKLCVIR
ncbi:hypothetical protein CSA37_12330 [Candidatus Fermentibacteria bacterium]|nr:MAG: hypothetical protein CSA37_12330 [Candidatus Fermentibacteria bacterium]